MKPFVIYNCQENKTNGIYGCDEGGKHRLVGDNTRAKSMRGENENSQLIFLRKRIPYTV